MVNAQSVGRWCVQSRGVGGASNNGPGGDVRIFRMVISACTVGRVSGACTVGVVGGVSTEGSGGGSCTVGEFGSVHRWHGWRYTYSQCGQWHEQ